MYSEHYIERSVSPTPFSPLKKGVKPNYSVDPAPIIAIRSVMGIKAAVAAEHTTVAEESSTSAGANDIELTDVPDSPHTPPNAPRKARDENHRPTYATAHQELFANLYNEFRRDFEQKGIPKIHATILKFAQERLAEQTKLLANRAKESREISDDNAAGKEEIQRLNTIIAGLDRIIRKLNAKVEFMDAQVKEQSKFIKVQDSIIPEQEYEIKEQFTIIKEGQDHIVEQGKRIRDQERRIERLEELLMEHGWDKEWLEDAMERMEQGATAKEALEAVEQID